MKRVMTCCLLLLAASCQADTLYVSPSGNHTPPFADWTTAATNIQSAVDAAADSDIVLVTNGVYDTGDRLSSRVVITNNITLQSVNGPDVTTIKGQGPMESNALRCVYITAGALSGFTLTNGFATYGGGLYASGGSEMIASNCTLSGNTASVYGGGSYSGTLYNCTITGNCAGRGGGVFESMYGYCRLYNCILYFNTALSSGANYEGASLYYSCTTPEPVGIGNITNEPMFVDYATGNYRLMSNSPCVDRGDNAYANASNDLDGFSNWEEWQCDTAPTNDQSYLGMNHITCTGTPNGVVIWWSSSTNRTYAIAQSTNLVMNPTFTSLASGIPGREGSTCYTDATAVATGPSYYRIGVE